MRFFDRQRRRHRAQCLTELLGRLEDGSFVEPTRQTVGDFLREWLAAIEARGLRPNTLSTYRMLVEKHLIPRVGSVPLQKLSASHLNSAYGGMLESGRRNVKTATGLSPRTLFYAHSVIRKALADAVKWNRLARNVADAADPPARPRRGRCRSRGLLPSSARSSRTSSQTALRLVGGWPPRRACAAARFSGLRGTPSTSRRGAWPCAGRLPWPTTSRGSRSRRLSGVAARSRWTPIPSFPYASTASASSRSGSRPVSCGRTSATSSFTDAIGRPIHPQSFSEAFERHVAGAGLRRIPLHGLRHTHATLALQAGIHPKVVSDRLGHYSAAFTLDTYSDSIPALQEVAAVAVAALVATASESA